MPDGLVRFGILGAAGVTPTAVIKPAKDNAEVEVAAVAARDVARGRAYAEKYGVAKVHDSYEALLSDPDIDAVYVPLPNALHGRWIRAAIEAGKHVLVEKPFAANAAEARELAQLADASGLVVMEGLHHRYHPASVRIEQILASGELGTIQRVEAVNCYWLRDFQGSRYSYALAGGATMDLGSYIVDTVRVYGGSTPQVVSAQVKLHGPQIDRVMTAELRFAEGHTGRLHCSMWSIEPPHYTTKVVGDRGELRLHPLMPFQRFSVRSADGKRDERFPLRATYAYQLDAFAGAVLRGEPVRTSAADAVENMTVIDAIYRAAGLAVREPA